MGKPGDQAGLIFSIPIFLGCAARHSQSFLTGQCAVRKRLTLPSSKRPISRISGFRLLGAVYCVASLLQRMFLGKIHRRELFIPMMNRLGSTRVLYQRVVTPPIAFC
jgi:hypothetical protein